MKRVTLRLDEDTWRALHALSESECRTMNAQVIKMVRAQAMKAGLFKPACPRLVSQNTGT